MFPIRRIYCIGRNDAAHAIERGSDPSREPPFFFQKPTDATQFVAPGITPDHRDHRVSAISKGAIWLKVNGNLKQNADLSQMIWSVAEQVSKLFEANELFPGDIVEMHIDGLPNLSVKIV
jgi:2-keto-4-pentenoate hydratase/2-oxohepta-3-ene-1,7-dioic acid hydratase in catechol pathway